MCPTFFLTGIVDSRLILSIILPVQICRHDDDVLVVLDVDDDVDDDAEGMTASM